MTGTPDTPEQREGRGIDDRSDIFSLGLLLYETATGTRPFQGALLFRSSRRSSRDLLRHAGDQVRGTGFVSR